MKTIHDETELGCALEPGALLGTSQNASWMGALAIARGLASRSALRFIALSGFSFVVNFGTTVLLHEVIGLRAQYAFAIALVLAVFTSFLGMRYFVLPGQHQGIIRQFGVFIASCVGFRVLEYLAFYTLNVQCGLPYKPVLFSTLVLSLAIKYPFYKLRVFVK